MRLLLAAFLVFASPLWAATRYVDGSASGAANGTSWANAWTTLGAITGLSAGDTVYISGGSSGNTQTYSLSAYWNPTSGSAGNLITYQIGQDASHNGTAIFNYTGGSPASNPFISGPTYAIFSGDAGDSACHFRITGFTVGTTNTSHVRYSYLDFTHATTSEFANLNGKVGIEIDHCVITINDLTADHAITGIISAAAAFGDSSIHHCTIRVPHVSATGFGADAIQWTGNGIDIYNNTITGFSAAYTGGQHQDGWQSTGQTNYCRVYDNTFVNIANYAVYGDAYSGNFTNIYVYNNLCELTDSAIAGGSPGGIIFGTDGGFVGTPPVLFTNVVIANNLVADYGANQAAYALNNVTGTSTTFSGCYLSNNISLASGAVSITGNATSTVANNVAITTGNGAANFVTYVQYGGTANNYSLKATASTLIGQGTDLSAYFTTDAAGYTRTVPWDIGAYKYLGVSGSSFGGSLSIQGNASVK